MPPMELLEIQLMFSFSSVLDNIKHAQEGGVDAWDTDSYLNIWVGKITSSVLGYSYAPNKTVTSSRYPIVHGVVIAHQFLERTITPNTIWEKPPFMRWATISI